MSDSRWAQTVANVKEELALMETSARGVGKRSQALQREAEYLKIEFLKHSLEEQIKAAARSRGMGLIARDNRKIGIGLATVIGGVIFGGLASKNEYIALNSGLSGLEGMLQELGKAAWAVSLGKELIIAPRDALPSKAAWVTFESLMTAIEDMKGEALQGKLLGNLDEVIQRLKQSPKLVHILVLIRN